MKNRTNIAAFLFLAFAVVQLAVPLSMIYQRELTLRQGAEYHFKTRPIDPTDPFRGKYVRLHFENESWITDTTCTLEREDKVYALLSTDSIGMAQIDSLVREKPSDNVDYLAAWVSYQYERNNDSIEVQLKWPFDRFYMEESKAKAAELRVNRNRRTDTLSTYAVVKIRQGNAVLDDVKVDGISLKTWVEQLQEEE